MNRIEWIDMAKGYGIICVIIGHIATPGITVWIYTFHIPLFFFLSGYLLHSQYSIREFLKRKVKSLIIPYFCLSIPVIFHLLFYNNGFDYDLLDVFKEIGLFLIQERHTPLWFIASLFWANLILFLVYKFILDFWLRVCIISFLTFIIYRYWIIGGNALPWNIDIAFQTPIPMYMIFIRDIISLILILMVLIPVNELIIHSKFKFIIGRS